MDVYDSPYRDLPAEGVGFLGKALALIALGAVLAEAWRTVRGTHERRLSAEGDFGDTVPAWEGDAVGSDLTGSGREASGAAGGATTGTGSRGTTGTARGRGDDFGGPDLTPTGVIPTTHH